MTKQETAARLFEIVRDMTPASAGARRSLAALSARLLRGDELDGIELLNGLMTAGAALDPLDVMSRGELDRLYKDISAAVNAAQGKRPAANPGRTAQDERKQAIDAFMNPAKELVISYSTGEIRLNTAEYFDWCSLSNFRQVLNLIEKDREETIEQIRLYLTGAVYFWKYGTDPKTDKEKRIAEKAAQRFARLLELTGPAPVKKTPVTRAAERILKGCNRDGYRGAYMAGGKQVVCDGLRLIRFNDPLPLPEDAGGLDPEKAIGPRSEYAAPLELPSLEKAKSLLKIVRRCKGRPTENVSAWKSKSGKGFYQYDFGEGLPAVDLEYLVDMLEALPGCKAYRRDNPHSPIYFTAENGDGILLPVRKAAEAAAA